MADTDVNTIVEWAIAGHSLFHIGKAIEEKWPGRKEYQAALMVATQEFFTRSGEADASVIRGFCLESYREVFRKLLEIGDFSGALKAVEKIEKLGGKA